MEDGTIVFFSTSAVFKNKKNVFALNTILSFYKIPTLGYCVRKHKVNQRELKQMEPILNFQVPAEGLELVILLHTQY